MVAFDATTREVCTVRRVRTNTPLQALVTLNDPAFFAAARALARRVVREAEPWPAAIAARGFRLVAARAPRPDELAELLALHARERARFARDPAAARAVAGGTATPELAAWTIVASVLLNLDEVISKE